MTSEPLEPTAPSSKENELRKNIKRKARSPLVQWILARGWKTLAILATIIVVAGAVVGPVHGFEYLAGVRAPSEEMAVPARYLASLSLTLIGWLVAPALVGAVAGYVVSTKLGAYRNKTASDLAGGSAP